MAIFLERVPILQPQIAQPVRAPTEPRLVPWANLAERLRGVQTLRFDAQFLAWLDRRRLFVEDFPYAGTDFTGDVELALPPGMNWDETGMCFLVFVIYNFFVVFIYIYIFCIYRRITNIYLLECRRGTCEARWVGPISEETGGSGRCRCEPPRSSGALDRRCGGFEDGRHSDRAAGIHSGCITADAPGPTTGRGDVIILPGASSSSR